MRKQYLVVLLTILVLAACQKEISFELVQRPPDPCRITTAYYYGGGGTFDTAKYVYTQERLTSLVGSIADVTYKYDPAGRIFSMSFYEKPGNLLYRIDTFYYLNDSLLSAIRSHDYDMYNHLDTIHSRISFNYTGNQLTRLVTLDSYEGYPDVDTLISDFSWENGNVKSILFGNSGWTDSISYRYDANPNFFNRASANFFMLDPFFELHVGFDFHLPYFISRNNVNNFTIYGNIDYPVSYLTDSLGNPTLVRQGGFDYMGYKWECR